MSSASEIVTDAFGLLTVIDINDAAPSPTEMTKALRILSQMIDSWATEGLSIVDQTRTCILDGTSGLITGMVDPLTSLVDVLKLAPGMNANGTGIPVDARIRSIDDVNKGVQLDQATTIAGSSVTVTFTALPFAAKFERGVAALLALQIAPLIGEDNIPPMTARIAQSGWTALQANFMRIPPVTYDPALVLTSIQRTTSAIPSG